MDVDQGRDLVDADGFVVVEIVLRDAALVDGDFVGHDGAESFEDGALADVFSGARIDDLAANVSDDPNFFDLYLFLRVHVYLNNFREIAAMRKLEGHAHGGPWGSLCVPQPDRVATSFRTPVMRAASSSGPSDFVARIVDARESEKVETELQRGPSPAA